MTTYILYVYNRYTFIKPFFMYVPFQKKNYCVFKKMIILLQLAAIK